MAALHDLSAWGFGVNCKLPSLRGTILFAALLWSILSPDDSAGQVISRTGRTIPESDIVRGHPALKRAKPVSKELSKYGEHLEGLHCFVLDEKPRPGPASLNGILYASNFPVGTLSPELERLRIPGRPNLQAALVTMHDYVLSQSKGDQKTAIALLKQAERHDARCTLQVAAEARLGLELLKEESLLLRDKKGDPYIYKPRDADARAIMREMIVDFTRGFKNALTVAAITTQQYEKLYGMLSTQASTKGHGNPTHNETPKAGQSPSSNHELATEMSSATKSLAAEIKEAASFCLLMASAAKC